MTLTGATVRTALAAVGAGSRLIRPLDELAAGADDALRQAPPGLTPAGAASWLATMAQESDYFRTTEEYGGQKRYDPYRGRTFEQVTWASNYRAFGKWCHARGLLADPEAFVRDPQSLAAFRWAWLGGVWYFEANGLWPHANRGNHWAVSQGVNRGVGAIGTDAAPNHWDARRKMFDAFRAQGAALLPAAAPKEDDMPSAEEVADVTVRRLLDTLIANPYTPADDRLNVRDTLMWGPVHAARALDGVNGVAARMTTLQNTVVALQATVEKLAAHIADDQDDDEGDGYSSVLEAIKQAVRDGLTESMAATGQITFTPTALTEKGPTA